MYINIQTDKQKEKGKQTEQAELQYINILMLNIDENMGYSILFHSDSIVTTLIVHMKKLNLDCDYTITVL